MRAGKVTAAAVRGFGAALALSVVIGTAAAVGQTAAPAVGQWPTYGGDLANTR